MRELSKVYHTKVSAKWSLLWRDPALIDLSGIGISGMVGTAKDAVVAGQPSERLYGGLLRNVSGGA